MECSKNTSKAFSKKERERQRLRQRLIFKDRTRKKSGQSERAEQQQQQKFHLFISVFSELSFKSEHYFFKYYFFFKSAIIIDNQCHSGDTYILTECTKEWSSR